MSHPTMNLLAVTVCCLFSTAYWNTLLGAQSATAAIPPESRSSVISLDNSVANQIDGSGTLPASAARSSLVGQQARAKGLSSLPADAQGPVSAALGKDDSSYWVHAGGNGLHAKNPRHALMTDFTREGAQVRSHDVRWRLATRAYGYGESLVAVNAATPLKEANRVEYRRGNLTEWYANGPLGLEQGFTLAGPPGKAKGQPLTIELALTGDVVAALEADRTTLTLTRRDGRTVGNAALRYTGLTARDAAGRQLRSWLELRAGVLRLRVDDSGARYPLVVDPWVQQAKLTLTPSSVVVSGTTAVVGTSGAAYVFVESGGTWSQQAELTESNAQGGDGFGSSVAVSGSTVVVGAPHHSLSILFSDADKGAAYVFAESGGTWSQQAELTASDGVESDEFGTSVAVSGSTILVGTTQRGGYRGAAYAFAQSGGTWSQQAVLTASDGAGGDAFAYSIVMSGSTAVIGAPHIYNSTPGAAYVFAQSGGTWSQQAELTASDGAGEDAFAYSIAMSGSTLLVGAPQHNFPFNPRQGTAYVFVESSGTWTQQAELTASDSAVGDLFGNSVAVSGSTAVIGAPNHIVDSNGFQGAAYVFVQSGSTWSRQAELTASDGKAFSYFGENVAVSGSTAVIGSPGSTNVPGSAYVFALGFGNGVQQAELTAPDGAANDVDVFGHSVAVSDNTALVGAPDHTVGSNQNQGSAYVFVESGGTSSQPVELTASDGKANDKFGYSVAVSGSIAVIGAPFRTVGSNSQQGAVYVFVDSGGTWSQRAELTASDGKTGDDFGYSVAVSGDAAVIGAPYRNQAQGAAYVFAQSGGAWSQVAELTASDGAAYGYFGWSVAASGSTAIVGASGYSGPGAAYVFVESGSTWSQQAELTASDGVANDEFGISVALSGSTALVGAWQHKVGSNAHQGAAYVFVQSGTTWSQQAELTASDGAAGDEFGDSVAISDSTLLVGAPQHTVGSHQYQGAAYVFIESGGQYYDFIKSKLNGDVDRYSRRVQLSRGRPRFLSTKDPGDRQPTLGVRPGSRGLGLLLHKESTGRQRDRY